ncbi:MAG: hypothetical protein J0I84_13560 [Terrimonas sp.]|nr:hypothetical protein [Terrimonas sp.]
MLRVFFPGADLRAGDFFAIAFLTGAPAFLAAFVTFFVVFFAGAAAFLAGLLTFFVAFFTIGFAFFAAFTIFFAAFLTAFFAGFVFPETFFLIASFTSVNFSATVSLTADAPATISVFSSAATPDIFSNKEGLSSAAVGFCFLDGICN